MLFGRQFLQGDTGTFDHVLGVHAMAAVVSMQAPGYRDDFPEKNSKQNKNVRNNADRICMISPFGFDVMRNRVSY